MTTARNLDWLLRHKLNSHGIDVSLDHCRILRRAQMTLHSWGEAECGDGNTCITVDDDGKAYREYAGHTRYRIPNREAGALRRVAKLCKAIGLHFYHQGDCRGCSLYVSSEPLTDQNYTNGVACYVD